jgi:ABC-type transport system involved in cytochrome c biogenesis ATPase subunit
MAEKKSKTKPLNESKTEQKASVLTIVPPQIEEISEIFLDQVSFVIEQRDPILKEVEILLPVDEMVVVETENPSHATSFLQLLAGRLRPTKGQLLWNQKNFFNDESPLDPHLFLGSYFESFKSPSTLTFRSLWQKFVTNESELNDLFDAFDLQDVCDISFKDTPYAFQKLSQLVLPILKKPQILVLEDPAYGLTEDQWLNFLDFIQLNQRRGHLRHLFLTNSHPTALIHLDHQKLYIADGMIYLDQQTGFKKVSHF